MLICLMHHLKKYTRFISATLSILLSSFGTYLSSFQHLPLIENFHGKNLIRVLHLHNRYLEYTKKKRQLPSHKLFKIACKVYFSNSKLSGFAFCLLRFWCRYSSCLMVVIFVLSDRGLGELGDNFLETKRLYL